jgi:hypothetical protein
MRLFFAVSLLWLAAGDKVFGGKSPVQMLADDRLDVIRAAILIVEIVGMFPDIDDEERTQVGRCEWRLRVGGLDDCDEQGEGDA